MTRQSRHRNDPTKPLPVGSADSDAQESAADIGERADAARKREVGP
jgi:hypothetical protein